jgi:hypothetical protein
MSDTETQSSVTEVRDEAGEKDKVWDDILEVIKELPWGVGPALVFIARRLGIKRSLLLTVVMVILIIGASVGLSLVYFGWAPNFVVSDKYNKDSKRAHASERRPPVNVEVAGVGDPKPDWLQPYVIWIEDEGRAQKDLDAALHVGVGAVSHELQSATTKFVWSLKANPGFELDGRAFLVTNDGFIKPLNLTKDGTSVDIDVPECEEKETLYAAVIAKWKGNMSPVDIQSTFTSVIKQGR